GQGRHAAADLISDEVAGVEGDDRGHELRVLDGERARDQPTERVAHGDDRAAVELPQEGGEVGREHEWLVAGIRRARPSVAAEVLESARELIAERGPGVALRDIADGAGVNFGLLYHYLGTKEQLVDEVYARATSHAAERLVEAEHLDEALRLLMTFGDGTTAR